jgi:3'-5' exoribonuclease
MLRTAESICGIYENLNADLVYAGVILHDMEKINEMQSDELGIVSTYTFDGQLLGHIIMGIKKIDEVAKRLEIDPEISSVLQHMILSHHYEAEYGSPKKPLIPEGEILHYLDMIDARMYDMTKALQNTEASEFANPSFVLDYRRLYKTKFDK